MLKNPCWLFILMITFFISCGQTPPTEAEKATAVREAKLKNVAKEIIAKYPKAQSYEKFYDIFKTTLELQIYYENNLENLYYAELFIDDIYAQDDFIIIEPSELNLVGNLRLRCNKILFDQLFRNTKPEYMSEGFFVIKIIAVIKPVILFSGRKSGYEDETEVVIERSNNRIIVAELIDYWAL